MANFSKTTVHIPSLTPHCNLEAWQYYPDGASTQSPPPVIVMAHGFGANKHMSLEEFAEVFVKLGYAVLLFDYRGWGGSEGTPRNCLIISQQLDDYRTVIKWARTQPEFDPSRVIVWGSSFSGGHIMQIASEDPALAAALGQCPFSDGITSSLVLPILGSLRILPLAIADLVKQAFGGSPVYVPNASEPGEGGALSTPGALKGLQALTKKPEDYPNQIQASALLAVPFYRPYRSASKIQCPFFLAVPRTDNLCPASTALAAVEAAPKGEHIRIPGGHFDCYPGFPSFHDNLAAQVDFLKRHVPVQKST